MYCLGCLRMLLGSFCSFLLILHMTSFLCFIWFALQSIYIGTSWSISLLKNQVLVNYNHCVIYLSVPKNQQQLFLVHWYNLMIRLPRESISCRQMVIDQECYWYYEAIKLGTIVITELDPQHYRHLRDAPFVYNTSTWNLSGTTVLQLLGLKDHQIVNRNMVFESFLDRVCRKTCGPPLRWWDTNWKQQSFLEAAYLTDSM